MKEKKGFKKNMSDPYVNRRSENLKRIDNGICNICANKLIVKKKGGDEYYYCEHCQRFVMKCGANRFSNLPDKNEVGYNLRCHHCGREYVSIYQNSYYCSPECREIVRKQRQDSQEKINICCVCGKSFKGNSALSKYCSAKCRKHK